MGEKKVVKCAGERGRKSEGKDERRLSEAAPQLGD
jgi:hypothetical protein